mmetsp:Transcript_93860/g.270414  ORF Transcript_93860/g.270414 Transcript_93860/m.270414 type:complete len:283 (+) Transcript_93860:3054-3902(+)
MPHGPAHAALQLDDELLLDVLALGVPLAIGADLVVAPDVQNIAGVRLHENRVAGPYLLACEPPGCEGAVAAAGVGDVQPGLVLRPGAHERLRFRDEVALRAPQLQPALVRDRDGAETCDGNSPSVLLDVGDIEALVAFLGGARADRQGPELAAVEFGAPFDSEAVLGMRTEDLALIQGTSCHIPSGVVAVRRVVRAVDQAAGVRAVADPCHRRERRVRLTGLHHRGLDWPRIRRVQRHLRFQQPRPECRGTAGGKGNSNPVQRRDDDLGALGAGEREQPQRH